MANSEARLGWGGMLEIGTDDTLLTLTEIGEVRSFNVPQEEADEHEVTHLKSPLRRKEYIAGLIDGGEVECSLNYVPGSPSDLLLTAARNAGDVRSVRFTIPDQLGAPEWQIDTSAFVKRYAPDTVEANAPITATLVLRISGASTEAAVTP